MPIDPRVVNQFTQLAQALPDLQVHPADWRDRDVDFDFLYRPGTLLARTGNVEAATTGMRELDLRPLDLRDDRDVASFAAFRAGDDVLPENRFVAEPTAVAGLSRLVFDELNTDRSVPQLLEVFDAVQPNAVTPDYLLHVCGHCCPAKEPEVVGAHAGPVPPVRAACGCDRPCDGAGVSVGLVDTGWITGADRAHTWLAGVTGDAELTVVNGEIREYGGHGTFGAGCIRVAAPKAKVHVEGTLTRTGAVYESDLAAQLVDALRRNPDVLVFTFATPTRNNETLASLDLLYETEISKRENLVVLAPANNDSVDTPNYPAAYDWVTGVGALSADGGARADYSNFGPWVDVYAPGTDLVNAYATGTLVCKEEPNVDVRRDFAGMASWSGTSFSTPLVAGMIAARMSSTGETARQARDALLAVARGQEIVGVGPVLYPEQACPRHGR